jgi:beta-glucosidase
MRGRRRWLYLGTAVAAAYAATCLVLTLRSRQPSFTEAEMSRAVELPRGFLWGTATSAHQVEGGNTRNDWAAFEALPGRIARGERSGMAVDHWRRVAQDVALMKALGANSCRLSIEWSRLEPEDGRWDEAAWEHYADELRQLRAVGIEPMVTLLHFTLPLWLAERGGVVSPEFPVRFARFAAEAARRLGDGVDLWCTLNEPNVQMYLGYLEGVWPPGRRSPQEAVAAFAGMLRAHAAAARAVRDHDRQGQVGVVVNMVAFDPASRWLLTDWLAAREAGEAYNWAFLHSIATGRMRLSAFGLPELDEPLPALSGSVDFVGINYYRRELARFSPWAVGLVRLGPGPGPRSDLGWEVHPEGLLRLLREAWIRYRLPLYVTENGVADAHGSLRGRFVRAHALAIERAAAQGIPVRGYYHWSLLDNFEWAEGFAPRFGLYRVEYPSLERRPAAGAEEFRSIAAGLAR